MVLPYQEEQVDWEGQGWSKSVSCPVGVVGESVKCQVVTHQVVMRVSKGALALVVVALEVVAVEAS